MVIDQWPAAAGEGASARRRYALTHAGASRCEPGTRRARAGERARAGRSGQGARGARGRWLEADAQRAAVTDSNEHGTTSYEHPDHPGHVIGLSERARGRTTGSRTGT